MGKVVSFLNMKGGVGKTTLCKEMGYHLSKIKNKKILLIDVDPQANLTQSVFKRFGYKQKEEESFEESKKKIIELSASVNAVFNYSSYIEKLDIKDAMVEINENLSIVPGDLNTLFLERTLGGSDKEHSLKNFIEDFDLIEKFHYIFLDCPPTYSFYTTAALLASDCYISPIKPDSYSILGLDLLQQVIEKLKNVHRERFRYRPLVNLGVIFSNIPPNPSAGISRLIEQITDSKKLKKYQMYFFSDYFLFNPTIPKQIEYFIDDSNSIKSLTNLYNIVTEFEERVEAECKEQSLSEKS